MLDMDGVITDFVGAAHRIHHKALLLCGEWPYPRGKYSWFKNDPRWGEMSPESFWAPMGEEFWEHEVKWEMGGKARLRYAEAAFGKENICIVTGPPPCLESGTAIAGAVRGKWKWIAREMSDYINRVIFTKEKHWLATPDRTLWDDSPTQVRKFRDAGGCAVLIKQPWNCKGDER
jgi:hypothetical protein